MRWRFTCNATGQSGSLNIIQTSVFDFTGIARSVFTAMPGFILTGAGGNWENFADDVYKPTVTVYGFK